ncbi:MAG TPA: MFS transporter [Spirochaetia bacterium]|nr:MFS transporter [Spirochaetales bacterium]HRY82004.1 MFS transporter [Spirochaetia bacterium]HRZ88330.1 MFS transporter [Spirochaetia bacterium]
MRSGIGLRGLFPREIYALFVVRLVVSAGSFVNPFLAMMLTMKLGYSQAAAGAFMSAVSVVSAAGLLAGGKLGDSLGRRPVLGGLQALTAASFAVCAVLGFVPAAPFVIAFALGVLSGTWPVMNAVVADCAPPERRKEAFALLYWGNNIGFSIGPLAAGFLFSKAPRLLFVGNAAALSIAAAVVFLFVRETNPLLSAPHGAPDAEKAAAEDAGRTSSGDRAGKSAGGTLRILAADPVLLVFAALAALTAFVYNQHTFALPLFLKDLFGPEAGPRAFGAAMAVNGLTVVVCTALVTAASHRWPALLAAAAGSVFYLLGFGAYALAAGLIPVLACTFAWTIGEILGATNNNVFIAERSPASHRGRINSAISFCYILGNALAPLVSGPAMEALGSRAIWGPIGFLAGVGALGLAALHVWDRSRGPAKAAL